jgi:predicted dehydrogenase
VRYSINEPAPVHFMRKIRFGIIGCGLMGREFASAVSRWHHLPEMEARPEIVAICDRRFEDMDSGQVRWFSDNFPTIRQTVSDYRELVANPEVEAVYCAVPHHLHEVIYLAVLDAGKHLMGEKPFGIDKSANDSILEACGRHAKCLVRCSSEFPFYPAVQRIGKMIEGRAFGRIIEVNTGFLHSSDLDPEKTINWKRMIEFNGEYGCMGDLGMHACHVPFRAGWRPISVSAILSKIVSERPDGQGRKVPCLTWDNATLLCRAIDTAEGHTFPWTIKTQRIAPGERNTWYVEISGTRACTKFSTKNPRLLQVLDYQGGDQDWRQVDMGYQSAFKAITGAIFEFGFPDSILQMWAGYIYELVNGVPASRFAGCVTPEETALSHMLFTAALASQREGRAIRFD